MTRKIEKLNRLHNVTDFDCGVQPLNDFLHKHALTNQSSGGGSTYLGLADEEIVGFYTLVYGEVQQAVVTERMAKGMAKHPLSVMILARMGVSVKWQHHGIGKSFIKDAVLRTLEGSQVAALRGLVVHAKNEDLKPYYAKYGFEPSPVDPLHMMVLMKDICHTLGIPMPKG